MRALAVVILIIAVMLFAAWVTVRAVRLAAAYIRARRLADAGWTVELDKQEQLTVVQLEKPGEDPYVIGSVPINVAHWEYEEALTDLRLQAEAKADAMNRRLSA